MLIKKEKILLLGLLLIGSLHTVTSQEQEAAVQKSIDKHAESLLKNKQINSVSIGIYKDGEVYTSHFGTLVKGKEVPPTNSSIYEIASVTKTMTGYLVAQAVLDKKIKLEDDIRIYLGNEYPNLEYNGTPITIKNLITHTSGLPKFLPTSLNGIFETFSETVPFDYNKLEKAFTKDHFLESLKEVSLNETPGINYNYSNAGAEVVGFILEKVYGQDIDTLYKRYLTGSIEMNKTSIKVAESNLPDRVQGYWMKNNHTSPNQLNTFWATGSGMSSTLSDLMRYIELQLSPENPAVNLSHEVLYQQGKTFKVGYFWRVWQDKYGTSYNHHGGTSGMQNWIFIYPKHNLGISILTNHSGPKTPNKLSKVVRNLLKDLVKT